MKRSVSSLILTAVVSFAAGGLLGLWAGGAGPDALLAKVVRVLLEELEESGESRPEFRKARLPGNPAERRAQSALQEGPFIKKPEPRNPLRGEPPERLIALLNRTQGEKDGDLYHHATEALLGLAREDPLSLGALLWKISRHGPMHQVCRELVLHGGEEGMHAVLDFILDKHGDMEMRAEAIHALGALPAEAHGLGMAGLLELSGQFFPRELQHSICGAIGEISGSAGVQNLLGLLKAEGSKIRPDIVFDTIGRIGTPGHAPQLLGLLSEGSWTREMQTAILRSAACVSRSGDFLLDLIAAGGEGPPAGVVAQALCDAAPWIELDPDKLLSTLNGDLPPDVRGNLSRALVRSEGDGELESLLARASEAGSRIDADSLGAALAESADRKLLPAMAEVLGDVNDPETLHLLARSMVEAGGREGIEAILSILEEEDVSGRHLHPLCGSIAEAGAPEDADRLFQVLERVRDTDDARALLKAAVTLSPEEGLNRCLRLLQDSTEGDVRAAAADILGRRSPADNLPQLLDVLSREEFGRAQWELTRAIAGAGDEGLQGLTEFLQNDQDERRKHEILSSLSELEGAGATPVLSRALLEDAQAGIRAHAAEILARLASEDAIGALAEALRREEDPVLRARIGEALSKAMERRGRRS